MKPISGLHWAIGQPGGGTGVWRQYIPGAINKGTSTLLPDQNTLPMRRLQLEVRWFMGRESSEVLVLLFLCPKKEIYWNGVFSEDTWTPWVSHWLSLPSHMISGSWILKKDQRRQDLFCRLPDDICMGGRNNSWSLSPSHYGTCFTHLLNLLKILRSRGCQEKDMETFRSRTQGINFKRPLLNLLPRNNKIFVSEIVNLPSMRNLQHIALASFPQPPSSPP